jgi:4-amino-4-deoxy-L-arabinose transferase-like glycosyltransferase
MSIKLKIVGLISIMLLAAVLRFYQLGSIPRAAQVDEAHFGYIAYSLLETGRDEHGKAWPLVFTGFGDDKLPMQAYLMMLPVKLFGLNNFAIRTVSAVSGTLFVLCIYFIAKNLVKPGLALIVSLLAALTPWGLLLSRFGYESNLALLIFSLGLIALFNYLKSNKQIFIWLSVGLLALTCYAYIAYRLVTFLFLGSVLLLLMVKERLKPKFSLGLFVFYLLLISPFLLIGGKSNTTRFNQLFGNTLTGITLEINENRTFCAYRFPRFLCDLTANKPYFLARELFSRYIKTFSPEYLMLRGEDSLAYLSVKNYGPLLIPIYFLFLYGLSRTIFQSKTIKDWILIIGTLIAPLPAVLVGKPQRVRLSALLVFLLAWSALGLKFLWQWQIKSGLKTTFAVLILVFSLFLGSAYQLQFLAVHTLQEDQAFTSYIPTLFAKLEHYGKNKLVVIKPFFSDPILHYAYYQKIDPGHYQQSVILGEKEASGFQHAVALDNIKVADISDHAAACLGYQRQQQAVLVSNQKKDIPLLDKISSSNGVHDYVYIYDASARNSREKCEGKYE